MSQRQEDQRCTDRTEPKTAVSGAPERLLRFFDELATSRFFGKVVIAYQNGKVCDLKIEQTKKLEEL